MATLKQPNPWNLLAGPYEEDNRIFTPEQMDEHAQYLTETAAQPAAA